jgi:hypothetical protein
MVTYLTVSSVALSSDVRASISLEVSEIFRASDCSAFAFIFFARSI